MPAKELKRFLTKKKKWLKSQLVKRTVHKKGYFFYLDQPQPGEVSKSPFHLINGVLITKKDQPATSIYFKSTDNEAYPISFSKRKDQEQLYPEFDVKGFTSMIPVNEKTGRLSGHISFETGGQTYNYPLQLTAEQDVAKNFTDTKQKKLQKIKPLLQCPECKEGPIVFTQHLECSACKKIYNKGSSAFNFMNEAAVKLGKVETTSNISAHPYDERALQIIEQFKNGLVLDCGAGLRDTYFDNVVNFEIVDYPTTDVVGVGESLPFKDNSFDAVFSFAVLEHVQDPFQCAREIIRVLKPGGKLYVAVPFLQPFHGYPNHYYNMTSSGIKRLFEEGIDVEKVEVKDPGHPIWMISWVLNSYIQGLPQQEGEKFKNMKVADLIEHPHTYFDKSFFTKLSDEAKEELACVNYLEGTKKS